MAAAVPGTSSDLVPYSVVAVQDHFQMHSAVIANVTSSAVVELCAT